MADGLKLVGVSVVNTRTGAVVPHCTVCMEAGQIREVAVGVSPTACPNALELDMSGLFVVPGFNDMHTHALQDQQPESTLGVMLAFGITGMRQLAGSAKLLLERAEGRFSDMQHAPEVLEIAGDILTGQNAANPEMAVKEVRKQASQGADFIKVIDVDHPTFFAAMGEAHRHKLPFLGHVPPTVDAAEASRRGMRSIEHLGPAEIELISCSKREWLIRLLMKLRPRPSIDLSPDKMAEIGRMIVANPVLFRAKLDPGSFAKTRRVIDSFSEEKCRRLARTFVANQTWQCPTLIRLDTMQFASDERFMDEPELRYVPGSARTFWHGAAQQYAALMTEGVRATLRDLMALELRMTKIFDEEGVLMVTGSDYGGGWVIPGMSLHQEFDLLARAGISPLRILQMTTLLAAVFLNRENTMGTVEAGRQANLVLLGGNPVESAAALHNIAGVVRDGHFYSPAMLAELKDKAATYAATA